MIQVKVLRKQEEAEGICSFELVSADGTPLPPFTAGAHVDVLIRPRLIRQYSICNNPQEKHRYLIAVLRDTSSRGGSTAMHDEVLDAHLLSISPPRNNFPLAQDAQRTMLIAGGIGITPLLAMAEVLSDSGSNFELHYCVRSRKRAAFLDRLANCGFSDHVRIYLDDEPALGRFDAKAILGDPKAGSHLYVCGPDGFMTHVLKSANERGWPDGQVHKEFFASATPISNSSDGEFEIELAHSGKVLKVPAGKRVLDVLWDAGVDVAASCEQGVCGTCLTRVISGLPDHRDSFLSNDERQANDQFTPCCSRSVTPRLTLDL
jgi:vanillate O-demethylase ferredoxin subunit